VFWLHPAGNFESGHSDRCMHELVFEGPTCEVPSVCFACMQRFVLERCGACRGLCLRFVSHAEVCAFGLFGMQRFVLELKVWMEWSSFLLALSRYFSPCQKTLFFSCRSSFLFLLLPFLSGALAASLLTSTPGGGGMRP